jgi:Patatin-like phospholipase
MPQQSEEKKQVKCDICGSVDGGPLSWDRVAAEEKNEINRRRNAKALEPSEGRVGLSFSGGGIRSATFNLGVLQGLATHKILTKIDYLSSVSGGSYINCWLNAWIHRKDFDHVNKALSGTAVNRDLDEAPISFLRQYSSFLTPRVGALSADTWTAGAMYMLKLLPNVVFFTILIAIFLLIVQTINSFMKAPVNWPAPVLPSVDWNSPPAEIMFALGLTILLLLWAARGARKTLHGVATSSDQQSASEATRVALLIFIASLFAGYTLVAFAGSSQFWAKEFFLFGAPIALAVLFSGVFFWLAAKGTAQPEIRFVVPSMLSALATAVLWSEFVSWYHDPLRASNENLRILAPFLFSVSLVVGVAFSAALHPFGNKARDWIYRFAGQTMLFSFVWLAASGLEVAATPILQGRNQLPPYMWDFLRNMKAGIILSWLATVVAGVAAGYSEQTRGRKVPVITHWSNRVRRKPDGRKTFLEILARSAPWIALIGLFWIEARQLEVLLEKVKSYSPVQQLKVYYPYLALGLLFVVIVGWFYDVNRSSPASFYRNRLVRCYLGATVEQPAADDLALHLLKDKGNGPYPIINAALNVTHGGDLSVQKRKGLSFTFVVLPAKTRHLS